MLALHGLRINVDGGPAASAARVRAVLEHFGAEPVPEGAADLEIQLARSPRPPAPMSPPDALHLDLAIHATEDGVALRAPGSTTWIRADGREIRHVAHDDAPLPLHVFTCALVHALRPWRAWVLHAACVAWGGRGALIVGPSGAGKSTLTLQLVQRGATLVSDDSVLLTPDDGALAALALRRGIFLDPERLSALPPGASWRPCPLVEAVKQELILPHPARADRCAPALLVLPEIADADHTAFDELDPVDAAYALAVESRLAELGRDGTQAQLAALCALAATTPAVRMRLGRDVLRDPEPVEAALRARLADRAPPAAPTWSPTRSPRADRRPVYAPIGGSGGLLLHGDTLDAFALDSTGALIWELAQHHPLDEVALRIAQRFDADPADVTPTVLAFADALAEHGTPIPSLGSPR